MIITDFSGVIADRIRSEHRSLAARWFERLSALLPVDAREIFSTESLLDHVPALILEIGSYLRHPDDEAIAANTAILDKARELGALRHAQRASLHQLLREYQVLNGVLITFVLEEIDRLGMTPPPQESVMLVSRLHEAVNVLSQATAESFVTLYTQTIADHRERLEQFTRMAAHEWRQPLGAMQFGVRLLKQADLDSQRTQRTLDALERNVGHLVDLTHKLEAVARINNHGDNPVVQEVSLTTVVGEAARQLREMAEARAVEIQIGETRQAVTVDVGRLELTFVNLLSNAIKYSDPSKSQRFVAITADESENSWCRITIRDNGVGIPQDALNTIFERFTRAHAERDDLLHVNGVGLGLSIVQDCVQAMGGRIDVESTEGTGTAFTVWLPLTPPNGSSAQH